MCRLVTFSVIIILCFNICFTHYLQDFLVHTNYSYVKNGSPKCLEGTTLLVFTDLTLSFAQSDSQVMCNY